MKNSIIKSASLLFVLLFSLAVFACAFTVGAVDDETDSPFEVVITPEQTDPPETKKPEEPKTTKPQTTKPRVTEEPQDNEPEEPVYNNNNNNNNANNDDDDTPQTVTETQLPEGSFYVYLEPNNGEKRKKLVLTEPSVVPTPDVPTRKGYSFVNWYADSKFTTVWDFSIDKAEKGTVLYAKWEAAKSTVEHKITVGSLVGGVAEVNPEKAAEGETVLITVTPEDGKRLKPGTLTINGTPTELLSFEMPAKDVTITMEFEAIPAEKNDNSGKLITAGAAIGVIAAILIVIFALRFIGRRKLIKQMSQPEEASDADETIVVENAFDKDGRRIKEPEQQEMKMLEDDNIDD